MILIMSAVSGIAGGAILAIVNVAASMEGADAPPDAAKTQPMLVFGCDCDLRLRKAILYSSSHRRRGAIGQCSALAHLR